MDHCDGDVDPERDPRNVDPEDVDPELRRELREEGIPIGEEDQGPELPPVEELEEDDDPAGGAGSSGGDGPSCPGCGSEDVLEADQALEDYRDQADVTRAEVRQAFRSAETYCNSCYGLSGGEFDQTRTLTELFG